jgi:hypothetical protein
MPRADGPMRRVEAFEHYYLAGPERSYQATADAFGVSKQSVKNWAKIDRWQERLRERDAEIAEKLKKKTDKAVVDSKSRVLVMIQGALNDVTKIAFVDPSSGVEVPEDTPGAQRVRVVDTSKLKVRNVSDFEKLVRLQIDLEGIKSPDKKEITIKGDGFKFIQVREQKRRDLPKTEEEKEAPAS